MDMTKPAYQVTELSSAEDLGVLMAGDVVNVRATYNGKTVEREMAITRHATACREIPGKLSFAHRASPDGIYHQSVPLEKLTVSDGKVEFDYSKGEYIRIWGTDWVWYDHLMTELHKAGLE